MGDVDIEPQEGQRAYLTTRRCRGWTEDAEAVRSTVDRHRAVAEAQASTAKQQATGADGASFSLGCPCSVRPCFFIFIFICICPSFYRRRERGGAQGGGEGGGGEGG